MKNLFVCFRRCFRMHFRGSVFQKIFPLFVLPIVVAFLVWCAFLGTTNYSESALDRFLFFSTLYCFWIGLFNSCQSISKTLETGEWSYWVLGLHQSRFRYLCNIFAATFVYSLIQVVVFVGALYLIAAGTALLNFETEKIFSCFGSIKVKPAIDGLLYSGVFFPSWIPSLFAVGASAFSAMFSGICFGMMMSAIIKNSSSALKFAIAVIVIMMISSSLVLDKNNEYSFVAEWGKNDTDKKHFPIDSVMDDGVEKKEIGKWLICKVSIFSPQRYFYNIGWVYCHKNTNDAVAEAHKKVLKIEEAKQSWDCLIGLSFNEIKKKDKVAVLKTKVHAVPAIVKIIFVRMFGEFAMLLLFCAVEFSITFLSVQFSSKYYEIR